MINSRKMRKQILFLLVVTCIIGMAISSPAVAQNAQLTFEDVMKWEDISDQTVSENGDWMAYSVWPDRGDGEVRVRHVGDGTMHTVDLGDDPRITKNGRWVGMELKPKLIEQIKAKKEKPKQGMALLNTTSGAIIKKDSVQSFDFSNDGQWVVIRHHQSKEMEDKKSKNRDVMNRDL